MSQKYFNSSVVGAQATAAITINTVPADGDTLTIPGDSPSVFTFAAADPGGVTWVDTSSGDLSTIAANLFAVMPTAQYSASRTFGSIALTWNAKTAAANANAITFSSSAFSATGFSGGAYASGVAGDVGDSGNIWGNSGWTVPAGPATSSDAVELDDVGTQGTASWGAVSGGSPGAINGATLTCPSFSSTLTSGSITTNSFTGVQNGGAVTLTGASATFTPSLPRGGTMTTDGTVTSIVYAGGQDSFTITSVENQYVLGIAYGGPASGTATLPPDSDVLDNSVGGPAGFGMAGSSNHGSLVPSTGGVGGYIGG